MSMTAAARLRRFWSKVRHRSDGCWIWLGSRDEKGYGFFCSRRAHIWAYENFRGPVPKGLVLDHLCRRPGCVNPFHLESVTNHVNNVVRGVTSAAAVNARKTTCKRGHPFVPGSFRVTVAGGRLCLACHRDYQRLWQRQNSGRWRGGRRVFP